MSRHWRQAVSVSSLLLVAQAAAIRAQPARPPDASPSEAIPESADSSRTLRAIANDPDATGAVRSDARLRLATVLRRQGHRRKSAGVLMTVVNAHPADPELLRRVAFIATGVAPDPRYWRETWRAVRFVRESGPPRLDVRYPNETPAPAFSGAPISLAAEDVDLIDLCRVLQDVGAVRVEPDESLVGRSVTLDVDEMPWDELLHRIAASHDLVLEIGETSVRLRARTHDGD